MSRDMDDKSSGSFSSGAFVVSKCDYEFTPVAAGFNDKGMRTEPWTSLLGRVRIFGRVAVVTMT